MTNHKENATSKPPKDEFDVFDSPFLFIVPVSDLFVLSTKNGSETQYPADFNG